MSCRCQQVQRKSFRFKKIISDDWVTQTNALLSKGCWFNKTVIGSFNEHSVWYSAHDTHAKQARKKQFQFSPTRKSLPFLALANFIN